MKRYQYLAAAVVLACSTSLASADPAADQADSIPLHRTPFAVVELFTSEGCSSCPPAEALLNRIDHDSRADDQRVFALAFHVDYWNRLGWADPFSDAAFTERQRRYAHRLRERSLYTPQMIVNGTAGFVGSDARRAERALSAALSPDATADQAEALGLGFVAEPVSDQSVLDLRWRVSALPDGAVLHVAVTEDGLSTDVPRGENRGRVLPHDGVVRVWQSRPLASRDGAWAVEIPADVELQNASAVLLVQAASHGPMLAAHRVSLTIAQAR